jgi:putative tryptophan/tyrosine transport system substrate-binding protein
MRRREFLGILGDVAALAPLSARAQRPERIRRIGVLMAIALGDTEASVRVKAFESAWPELGWVRARNIEVDYRWAPGGSYNLRTRAAELVASAPEVILTVGTPVLAAVRAATRSIPIVFAGVSDPDGTGIIASMARPGGSITGFANFEPSIAANGCKPSRRWLPV